MRYKIILLISVVILTFSCNRNSKEHVNDKLKLGIDNFFTPLFIIDSTKTLNKTDFVRIMLTGKFNYNDTLYYALTNYFNKRVYFYNAIEDKITKEFELPTTNTDVSPYVYQVFNFDSIVYLDYHSQELVICNTNIIKHRYNIKIDESSHYLVPTFPAYFLSKNEILLPILVRYTSDLANYDSLMDIRPLFGVFAWDNTDTLLNYKLLQLQSVIKLNVNTEYKSFYNKHIFTFNTKEKKLITLPDVSDNFTGYDLKAEKVFNPIISNSKYKIIPVKVKNNAKVYEMQQAAENQNFNQLFYDETSDKYLRKLTIKKIDKEGIVYKENIIEIIDKNFNVENELSMKETMNLYPLLNKVILSDFSNPLNVKYYEFTYHK
ncbi:MAG: hypothetical protein K0B10_14730 [Vicingaceae bacterium]|nr:hypothetical protein [Vicingaceae bacterium]